MQYLTYEEYLALGGSMAEAAFPLAELRARKRIDALTQGRVARMVNSPRPTATPLGEGGKVPEAVKAAMMEVIAADAVCGASAQAASPLVTAFTTDGYSERYGSGEGRAASVEAQLRRTLMELLDGEADGDGVPLLFAGVDP